jgi:hypothetical protein
VTDHNEKGPLPLALCFKITPRYTVINCFGIDKIAAKEKTTMPIPHVEKTAVVTEVKLIQKNTRAGVHKHTMTRNSTHSGNKGNPEPAISHNPRETGIKYFLPLKFLSPSAAAVLECTGKAR